MKMRADRLEGPNAISRHGPDGVVVGGVEFVESVLVPWTGAVEAWPVASFEALAEAHFARLAALAPELVIFGSGARLRFVKPALLRPLLDARIGVETMDTAAACRTYNVLLAEGRAVLAALLFETAPSAVGRSGAGSSASSQPL
ncbi:MAG: Mth938-like domain-containing protein [Pseudomonadota bacterium]|nr:Mth938-like domain-containing protein [Pseudomonadota bacterium]